MSIRQTKKQCPLCGKMYDFNPAVGKIFCPHCKGGMGKDGEFRFGTSIPVKLPHMGAEEEWKPERHEIEENSKQ